MCEVHQLQTLLGLRPRATFYLFGAPIQQSMSPLLHNTGAGLARISGRGLGFAKISLSCMGYCTRTAGFERLSLPYRYELLETDAVEVAAARMNAVGCLCLHGARSSHRPLAAHRAFASVARPQPDFGGASVTIPLKEAIVPHVHKLTPAARAIGVKAALESMSARNGC